MDYKISILELEEFNNMVDNIIIGIEKGTIVSNPLKKEFTDLSAIVVEETATEKGEEIESKKEEEPKIKFYLQDLLTWKDLTKFHVIIYNSNTNEVLYVYDTAADAARMNGLNPTTIRNRCKASFKDALGNVWCYYDESIVPVNKNNKLEL